MRLGFCHISVLCSSILATSSLVGGDLTLPEAAASFRKSVPKGCIITAESVDGATTHGEVGTPEPPDTPPQKVLFEIGSISKVFTGLLLAQAVLEEKVTPDTTLREIMGGKQSFADPAVAAITLKQLATHTSGLPRLPDNLNAARNPSDPYAAYDRPLLDAAVAKQKLKGKPPFGQSYSNYGMGLLGDLLARLYGKSWEELVVEKITKPLGMSDTVVTLSDEQQRRFAPPYNGEKKAAAWHLTALAGAGALRSSSTDLLKFGAALLSPSGTQIKEALELMQRPLAEDGAMGYGIMLDTVDGESVREHNGATGGYRALLQMIPGRRTVRVVLSNNASVDPSRIVSAMRNERPRTVESDKVIKAEDLGAYEGVYNMGPKMRFTVVRHGDQLWTQLTGQGFLRLYAHEKEDRFFLKAVAAELQFHRGTDGRVLSLTNHQNGRESTAMRSDKPAPPFIFHTAKELAPFAGTYELLPGRVIKVKAADGTLWAQLTGQSFLPVFQRRDNRFEYDLVEAALEFEQDKDGKMVSLKLHQNGLVLRAVKKS